MENKAKLFKVGTKVITPFGIGEINLSCEDDGEDQVYLYKTKSLLWVEQKNLKPFVSAHDQLINDFNGEFQILNEQDATIYGFVLKDEKIGYLFINNKTGDFMAENLPINEKLLTVMNQYMEEKKYMK